MKCPNCDDDSDDLCLLCGGCADCCYCKYDAEPCDGPHARPRRREAERARKELPEGSACSRQRLLARQERRPALRCGRGSVLWALSLCVMKRPPCLMMRIPRLMRVFLHDCIAHPIAGLFWVLPFDWSYRLGYWIHDSTLANGLEEE